MITLPTLTPAQESLFLTLGGRALDSRLPDPFLGDTMAEAILTKTGYDPVLRFPTLRGEPTRTKVFDIAVRAKRLDEVVGSFVAHNPDAVVVDLGVGLDTRYFRVDPPATVDWYDVDLGEVMDLRHELLPRPDNVHPISADVTDPDWLTELPADRPTVIVADGLVAFLSQDGFVSLLNRLTRHFAHGEIAFNQYTTLSIFALHHAAALRTIADDVINPGFDDRHAPERWVSRLRLVEEIHLTRAPELANFPLAGRLANLPIAAIPALSRKVGSILLRYAF